MDPLSILSGVLLGRACPFATHRDQAEIAGRTERRIAGGPRSGRFPLTAGVSADAKRNHRRKGKSHHVAVHHTRSAEEDPALRSRAQRTYAEARLRHVAFLPYAVTAGAVLAASASAGLLTSMAERDALFFATLVSEVQLSPIPSGGRCSSSHSPRCSCASDRPFAGLGQQRSGGARTSISACSSPSSPPPRRALSLTFRSYVARNLWLLTRASSLPSGDASGAPPRLPVFDEETHPSDVLRAERAAARGRRRDPPHHRGGGGRGASRSAPHDIRGGRLRAGTTRGPRATQTQDERSPSPSVRAGSAGLVSRCSPSCAFARRDRSVSVPTRRDGVSALAAMVFVFLRFVLLHRRIVHGFFIFSITQPTNPESRHHDHQKNHLAFA